MLAGGASQSNDNQQSNYSAPKYNMKLHRRLVISLTVAKADAGTIKVNATIKELVKLIFVKTVRFVRMLADRCGVDKFI